MRDHGDVLEYRRSPRVLEIVFRAHAAVWALVNVFLILIWAATGAGYFWPFWTIIPWGFALAIQAWVTWGFLG